MSEQLSKEISLGLSGLTVKGRHGWFNPQEAAVQKQTQNNILIQVFSSRKPTLNLAPFCIEGERAAVVAFLKYLLILAKVKF